MTTFKTLLLDRTEWDLVLDSAGNIAIASPPYALSQDVASALKLFLGELWYDTGKGVPYFDEILGQLPPMALMTARLESAVLSVPGVVSAQCIITEFLDRAVSGQVRFTDETGASNAINF